LELNRTGSERSHDGCGRYPAAWGSSSRLVDFTG
jgi:hypothetical protein